MAQLAFTVGLNVIGPLLADMIYGKQAISTLRISTSTYGTCIPRGYGTIRTAGNLIWATPPKPKTEGGKGGLGGEQTYYTITIGVSVGVGPIIGILRAWADGKVIYDATGQTTQDQILANLGISPVRGAGALKTPDYNVSFFFYSGSPDQVPSAPLEAFVGAENALAHRGIAHVVVENMPLQAYGNRIPNMEFEVVYSNNGSGLGGFALEQFNVDWGGDPVVPVGGEAILDPVRTRAYFRFNSPGGFAYCGLNSKNTQLSKADEAIFFGYPDWPGDWESYNMWVMGTDGNMYVTSQLANSDPIWKVDGNALVCLGQFGSYNSGLSYLRSGFPQCSNGVAVQSQGTNFLVCQNGNDVGVLNVDVMGVTALDGEDFVILNSDSGNVTIGPGGKTGELGSCYKVAMESDYSQVNVYRLDITGTGGISQTFLGTLLPSQVNINWTNINNVAGLAYNSGDGNIIFGVQSDISPPAGASASYIIKFSVYGGDLMWAAPVNTVPDALWSQDYMFSIAGITNGEYCFIGNENQSFNGANDHSPGGEVGQYTINTADGSWTRNDWPILSHTSQTYNGTLGAIMFYGTSTPDFPTDRWLYMQTNTQKAQQVSLASVVSDICEQAGYLGTDIDVTQLEPINIDGFIINRKQTAKTALEPLGIAYQFDAVESDNTLKFVLRGGAPIATVSASDLSILDSKLNARSEETRTQEINLPSEVSIHYLDTTRSYEQSAQYSRRSAFPVAITNNRSLYSVDFDMAMDPNTARQLADILLYTSYAERTKYKVKLPWSYLVYDPTDVLTLELSDDSECAVRVTDTEIGGNLAIEMTAISESAATFTSNSQGDGGEGFGNGGGGSDPATMFTLFDMPLARDLDDTGLTSTIIYYGGGGYTDGWTGVEVYKSLDGNSYVDENGVTQSAVWGVATTALGDTSSPFRTDYVNTVNIALMSGDLASISYLQMMNGANAAALVNIQTGVVEIIQFQNATVADDGSVQLSVLMRGRRGTELFTGGHLVGDYFYLLADETGAVGHGINSVAMALSDLNVQRFFKPVPLGTNPAGAPVVNETDTGRTLMPYAPVFVAGAFSGSDIDLTWRRRTRVGGAWMNGPGSSIVPLSESTEGYEVDIYDAEGVNVLRTLSVNFGATPVADPGVDYPAADILADFGATPSVLTLAVYQMGTIGRGFGEKITIVISGTPAVTSRFWGVSPNTTLTEEEVLALGGEDYADNYNKSVSYNCTGGNYFYFAFPATYGTPAHVLVNYLPFSDLTVSVQSVGGTSYNVIRCNRLQHGSDIPVVWQ